MLTKRRSLKTFLANRLHRSLALTGLLVCTAGCNPGAGVPATEAVSGTVTLKGKPIAGVEVYFVSDRLVALGTTDAQGRYELVQGAVAGENKVYFSKIEGGQPAFALQEGIDDYQLQMATASGGRRIKLPKQVIPAEYSDPLAPKLNFLVPDGGTDAANFKL